MINVCLIFRFISSDDTLAHNIIIFPLKHTHSHKSTHKRTYAHVHPYSLTRGHSDTNTNTHWLILTAHHGKTMAISGAFGIGYDNLDLFSKFSV